MIFSHLPQDRRWQLLDRPLPARAFHAQPDIPRAFFELGIGPDRLRAEMQERSFAGFRLRTTVRGMTSGCWMHR
jgi:hypothetical protein